MQRHFSLSLLAISLLLPLPPARSDEAAEKLILATYKLANEASTATGMVVRHQDEGDAPRSFVVTAHHVLEQARGDACVLVSRLRRDDGTFQRHEIEIPIREAGRQLWRKHARHDLAVLPLPRGVDVAALPLDSLATAEQFVEVRAGDAVRLAVFPERVEANSAGFPILRGGSIASYPVTPVARYPLFLVDTATWTGDSGGPVIHASLRSPSGGPLIIGVVRGMRQLVDTVKESRFVERKTHYPMGISEVLHAALVRELIVNQSGEENGGRATTTKP